MKHTFFIENMRQVKATLNRFFAILIITVLGVAFFAGLRATGPAMRDTGERFMDEANFMDIQLLSTVGFNEADVAAVSAVDGVLDVAPGYSADVLAQVGTDAIAVKLLSLSDSINKPQLLEGAMPNAGETLVDPAFIAEHGLSIGDSINFASGTSDPLEDTVKSGEYVISGTARSPLYISDDRGASTVGGGKTEGYFYVPAQDFSVEAYTEIYLTAKTGDTAARFDEEYIDGLKPLEERLKALGKERSVLRYDEIKGDAEKELEDAKIEVADGYKKLEDAKVELEDAKVKLTDAGKELEDAKIELADGKREYEDGKAEFEQKMADAEAELADGQRKYDDGLTKYKSGLAEYEAQSASAEAEFAQAEEQLAAAKAQYDEGMTALDQGKELQQTLTALLSAGNDPQALGAIAAIAEQIAADQPELSALLSAYSQNPEDPQISAAANAAVAAFGETLAQNEAQLAAAKQEIDKGYAQIEEGRAQLAAGKAELDSAKAELDSAKRKLESGRAELEKGRAEGQQELSDAAAEIADGERKLADGEREYADGQQEYTDGLAEYESERADALADLAEGEQKIADGEAELADISDPEWFVLNNETNPGFVSYKQDTHRLDAISAVIPVFFFMLAIFVTMTSMTRLVETDRSYIGTVKALGYGDGAIALRYLLYAFSASFFGGLLGLVVGYNLLPNLIFDTYGMTYSLPAMQSVFPVELSFISVGIAVICATLPAYLVCLNSVHEKPSELMRPEAPKDGKRILLERFTPLWKRLNFMQKVTVRNIFRYKKRFIMTLVGVAGCTALMFTGFSIQDAISTVIPKQYDQIFVYDMQVGYSSGSDMEYMSTVDSVAALPDVTAALLAYQTPVDATAEGVMKATSLVVTESAPDGFINLRKRSGGAQIALADDSVIISEKLANLLGAKVGDSIALRDSDSREATVRVGGINENYISHYVYMSKTLYENAFDREFQPNQGFYKLNDVDAATERTLSADIMDMKDVSSISFISDSQNSMQSMLDALNIVVLVLVVSAAALIFVVLFSLISINIEERNRELATIKVLGFYDNELSSYIYRESNILTIIGIIFGLLLGILLQRFILTTMESNFLMFSRDILWQSYVYSAGLTGAFALLVNLMMKRHFRRIDMISSLKSIE